MKKVLCPIVFLCIIVSAHAQREINNPLVDSKEIIKNGVEFHDKSKFKEAITEYLKVPASDTGYADVLHELMLSYYNDSNFVAAEKYVRIAQQMFPERSNDWYSFLADIYDDSKRTELALPLYDSILAQDKYNYLACFNKGIALLRLSKMDEAEKNFQRCVILNPYYSSAHHFLGRLALLKGNLPQAMMSFSTNLLVAPENRYLKSSVEYLITIAEVNNSVEELLGKHKTTKDDDFEMVQDIIASKIALDKKYKLKCDLEDKIVRQLQVMMEKLEFNANDKGFWMQYYVPMFKKIWDDGQFEPMVYDMFSGLDIKQVKDYVKKDKKKIEAVSAVEIDYLNYIRESQELAFNKRENAETKYYIKNYKVNGKGSWGRNSKGEAIFSGLWEFYYNNGKLSSKGTYDAAGLRQGEWKFYYSDGLLKEISSYKDDKTIGKVEVWWDNGIKYREVMYDNDEKNGEETTWYYNGMLKSVMNYKAGKKEGPAKYYHLSGYLKTKLNYTNDEQTGEEIAYYENGKIESEASYAKDLPVGAYKEYYENSGQKNIGQFSEGKKTGLWKTYFESGKPESESNYVNGELDGAYNSWYENGKVETKSAYRKGEVDGKKEDYDEDGIISQETIFERGRLRDIKFLDKKGNIISNTTSRKGNANIAFYSSDGSKYSEGYYSKEGLLEGKSNVYYKNGNISTEGNYKNGVLEGKRTLYYENGKLKQEGTYTANNADGYFVDYYLNGEVMEEGWYVDDKREGTVLSRNLLGQLTSKVYYLNNEVHGITEYLYPTGNTDYKCFYDNGWLYRIEQYDSTGNVLANSVLNKGDGIILFKHFNGKPYIENTYRHYKLNGPYSIYNGDGSKSSKGYYKNGLLDSTYTQWHPNGKIAAEGKYANGKKTGTWKTYWNTGQLSDVQIFKNGNLHGKLLDYNEDGSIDKEFNYENGVIQDSKTYADKQLAIAYYYKNGTLQGYSYEDKAGKILPIIPIEKGKGKVAAFFKNGSKSVQLEFNEYETEGERILFHPNGKEYVTSKRINGVDNGVKKIFYPSGKVMREENYLYGSLHGHAKYFAETGELISDENYYLGSLHGEAKHFTAGKLTSTYTYYFGSLESIK